MFVDAVRRCDLEAAARRLNVPQHFNLANCRLPTQLRNFNDLYSLFWLSPLNRGVLRQDFDEASALFSLIRSLTAPTGVEIGRYFGGSTILLAVAVGEKGHLLSIDCSPRDDQTLTRVLQQTGLAERVSLLIGDANEVNQAGPFDFILIDGDHSYSGAKRDLDQWGPRLRHGGYAVFHDMAQSRPLATQIPDLTRLRGEMLAQKPALLELDHEVGSMSIWRRSGPVA